MYLQVCDLCVSLGTTNEVIVKTWEEINDIMKQNHAAGMLSY